MLQGPDRLLQVGDQHPRHGGGSLGFRQDRERHVDDVPVEERVEQVERWAGVVHDLAELPPGVRRHVGGGPAHHLLHALDVEVPLLVPVVRQERREGRVLLGPWRAGALEPEEGIGRGEGLVQVVERDQRIDPNHGTEDGVERGVGLPAPEVRLALPRARSPQGHDPGEDLLQPAAEEGVPGVRDGGIRGPEHPEVLEPVRVPAERQDGLEGLLVHLGVDHQAAPAALDLLGEEGEEQLRLAGP